MFVLFRQYYRAIMGNQLDGSLLVLQGLSDHNQPVNQYSYSLGPITAS